jgi:DNA polymerase (family 10)
MTEQDESVSLSNRVIAERLEAFASLLELAGSGFYTARAYRRAAETIRETLASAEELIRAKRIRELRGIGPGIASTLAEFVNTGTIAELDELERVVRPDLIGLARYLGLGP